MKVKLEKKHYQWGLTAFMVIVCSVLLFFALYRFNIIYEGIKIFVKVLEPFIYGLVMAYLLCPIYNFSVCRCYALMNRGKYKFKYDLTFSKAVGSIISLAILITVIMGVLWMIIPGLIESLVNVVDIIPSAVERFSAWIDVKFADLPVAKGTIDEWTQSLTDGIMQFAKDKILPQADSVVLSISGTVLEAVGTLLNFLIGIIVCGYFLNIKDTLAAQAKKFIVATFNENRAEEFLAGAAYTNRTFGGFINGKIIDSAIIGIICFICMSIFQWEYTLLISCIVGITNIIPFFGPFIGAIPSALLLLMVDPMQSLYFVIFIFILQQFDGNILGPKILGETTGIASFWVLFSVLVGGGLFGFIGMVLGIPVFAVIYTYFEKIIDKRLARKGFSTETADYKVDKYRVKRDKDKKRRFGLKLRGRKDDSQESQTIEQSGGLSDAEAAKAAEEGHQIFEATVVEYEETEETEEKE